MSDAQTIQKNTWYNRLFNWLKKHFAFASCLLLFIAGCLGTLYAFHQHFDWGFSYPANHEQWGLYGDFIGGVLGTIVAIFSVYFLIQTLRAQVDANGKEFDNFKEMSVVYKAQQFNNNFNHLVKLYHDAIEGYKKDGAEGKDALKILVEEINDDNYNAQMPYRDRVIAARSLFERKFYMPYRPNAAVHFRVLYRIFDLIENSGLNEREYKSTYAKLVRCQLDEDELVLLRYNCGCMYGEPMREHINHYNLLKHLPPFRLLEFRFWRDNVIIDSDCRNALDTELIAQRKWIIEKFSDASLSENSQYSIQISPKYELLIEANDSKKRFVYRLVRHDDVDSELFIDKALDMLGNNHIFYFLKDYLREVFEYSNFGKFNEFAQIDYVCGHEPIVNEDRATTTIEITLISQLPMCLRYKEFKNGVQEEMPEKIPSRWEAFIQKFSKNHKVEPIKIR